MTLKAQLVTDGPLFVSSSEFGESVTYIQSGVSTAMNALVLRGDMARVQAIGGRSYAGIMVKLMIPVSTLAAVKVRVDTVTFLLRPDDAAVTTFRITKILEQDEGMWTIEAEG